MLTGIYPDVRNKVPKGTSFVLEDQQDWLDIAEAGAILPAYNDFHLGAPNAFENTKNAVIAGSTYNGVFAQITWDYPECEDEVANICENIKALGLIAGRYDKKAVVDTYMDDGLPSYFLDLSSYLGYALMEKYVISDLCGARYCMSFGQMVNQLIPKMALLLAGSELLKKSDQPGVGYLFSNCIDHWDHDLDGNYGVLVSEMLMAIIVEKKYKTGVALLPIPITEKVAVPTAEGIANIHAACQRAAELADDWAEVVDFSKIEAMRDLIKEAATAFFDNMLDGFAESGIDITNPIEILLVLKRINPAKLEELFHSSTYKKENSAINPVVSTTLGQRSLDEVKTTTERINAAGGASHLQNLHVLVVSADAHWYGAFVILNALNELGADVENGGVGIQPADLLDMADEEGILDICISVHNGQALGYAEILLDLAQERGRNYRFFMGGKLNAILEGDSEPSDVTGQIRAMGIRTSDTIEELVNIMKI
jgi:methylmalonyl-CoA mutase cobalamin-binding subunit